MPRWGLCLLACCVALPIASPACAQAVQAYRCVDRQGRVSFQDMPCPRGARSSRLNLPDAGKPAPAATAIASASAASVPPPPLIPQAAPAPPLPAMYTCIRATDGKRYLSDQPTLPYYAPLAMVDGMAGNPPLGNGISVKPTASMVAGAYTPVQDDCRELSPVETCAALEDAYEKNAAKLSRAFRSDQPPLERRDAELRGQLRACPGH